MKVHRQTWIAIQGAQECSGRPDDKHVDYFSDWSTCPDDNVHQCNCAFFIQNIRNQFANAKLDNQCFSSSIGGSEFDLKFQKLQCYEMDGILGWQKRSAASLISSAEILIVVMFGLTLHALLR